MKVQNLFDWWACNRNKLTAILWLLPKKWRVSIGTAIAVIDYLTGNGLPSAKINFNREVLPCIRVNADGSTTLINCKTGAEIPKKA
jgi:hypothetical protein